MPASPGSTTATIDLSTDDGVDLTGDLALPPSPVAGAVLCHPHPQYGGTRHDHVVDALFRALPDRGVAALRFDFRREFAGGVGEVADARAAIERLRTEIGDRPLFAIGYSFGAMIVLALDDATLAGKVLVAPPLAASELRTAGELRPGAPVATLVVTPEHDQFSPPSSSEPIVARWPDTEMVTVPMADHFLHGRTGVVTDEVTTWVQARLTL